MYTKEFIEKMKYYHELNDHEYIFSGENNSGHYQDISILLNKEFKNDNLSKNEESDLHYLQTTIWKAESVYPSLFFAEQTDKIDIFGDREWDFGYPIEDFQKKLETMFGFNKEDRGIIRENFIDRNNNDASQTRNIFYNYLDRQMDYLDEELDEVEKNEKAWNIKLEYQIIKDLPDEDFVEIKNSVKDFNILEKVAKGEASKEERCYGDEILKNKFQELMDKNQHYKEIYKKDYEYHINELNETEKEQQDEIASLLMKPKISINEKTGRKSFDGKGFIKGLSDHIFELETKKEEIRETVNNRINLKEAYSPEVSYKVFEAEIIKLNDKLKTNEYEQER